MILVQLLTLRYKENFSTRVCGVLVAARTGGGLHTCHSMWRPEDIRYQPFYFKTESPLMFAACAPG